MESNIHAIVLLNLLNELSKCDKMRGPHSMYRFCQSFFAFSQLI